MSALCADDTQAALDALILELHVRGIAIVMAAEPEPIETAPLDTLAGASEAVTGTPSLVGLDELDNYQLLSL